MTQLSDLGVLGLAVMGANLARNAARKGFGVALYNRHGGRTDDLVRDFGHEGRFTPTKDLRHSWRRWPNRAWFSSWCKLASQLMT